MEWQPIETAPRDGTKVILSVGGDVRIGYFRDEASFSYGVETFRWTGWYPIDPIIIGQGSLPATHWMPFSALPDAVPVDEKISEVAAS